MNVCDVHHANRCEHPHIRFGIDWANFLFPAVGVTVVDRFGQPQAYLKNRYAGLHVYDTSRRKAWTAVSFRTPTSALAEQTKAGSDASAIRLLDRALPLGGGLVVYSGEGSIVAGIGVSGAPGPKLDEVCAQNGIDAIGDDIAF
ncbi:MAG: heme-binding protein [Rhodobacteraceae bacterium]|nr:heme-binding protein [Paracoccaceae bacterium]